MKSLQLLVYRDEKIELYAKDFNPAWMTSTIMLDEQVFIGADSSYNMFSLKKFPESANDEERSRLEVSVWLQKIAFLIPTQEIPI